MSIYLYIPDIVHSESRAFSLAYTLIIYVIKNFGLTIAKLPE